MEKGRRRNGGSNDTEGKSEAVDEQLQSDALIASLLSKEDEEGSSDSPIRRRDRKNVQIMSDAELAFQLSQQPPTPEPVARRGARLQDSLKDPQPKKFLRVGSGTGGGKRRVSRQTRGFGSSSSRFGPGSTSDTQSSQASNPRTSRNRSARQSVARRRRRGNHSLAHPLLVHACDLLP